MSHDSGADVWSQIETNMVKPTDPTIDRLYASYRAALPEYKYNNHDWSFWHDNPFCGWKFHLDVAPENVEKVAHFLKSYPHGLTLAPGFEHKYLSGSAVEQGKVFTVYTGSKENTQKTVIIINSNIGYLLQHPRVDPLQENGEIEFGPDIYGRFVGSPADGFRQYGPAGISYLELDNQRVKSGLLTQQQAFQNASTKALQVYGDYYGGGITPYHPDSPPGDQWKQFEKRLGLK